MICFSYKKQKGAVMIICLIFLCVFSALAISMSSFSDSNVQVADNQLKANRALESAHSGLEVMRFWLGRVYMPGTTTPEDRFTVLANFIQDDLQGVGNIPVTVDTDCIELGSQANPVTLETAPNRSFAATIQPEPNSVDVLQMYITGSALNLEKTIRVNYNFGTRAHTVFDYGVATKGPLQLQGNIEMDGANVELDAGVYIESNDANALSIIGNSSIAGDVSITNSDAIVDLQGGQASIGGETGQDAIDNHVNTGVPSTEFPVPIPGYFEHYVQNTYDPNNILSEYENVRIPAGINPIFSAVTLRGIVFIETPNVVTFNGNTEITGVIVGNGDLDDDSGTNQIIFLGDVTSHPVSDLPESEPQFDQLRDETGTFLMAPGFNASFGGSFATLNGAIAANGIEFFGNAGGTIDGSILNYSDNPMTLSGNSDLFFNRSGTNEMPAGFGPELILFYVADSYSEVVL
jgi:hypothetical protein